MSQTSIIAAALIIGYIVFIVMRGEAQAWLAVVGLGSSPITSGPAPSTSTINTTLSALGSL